MRGSHPPARSSQSRSLLARGVVGFATLLTFSGAAATAATFTVNSTADTDDGACNAANCTLREAIIAANGTPAADTIRFVIGSGVRTIALTSELPAVSQPAILDGTTQPGFAGSPIIELTDAAPGTVQRGLVITAGASTVRGLAIYNFTQGIQLNSAGNNVIRGNYIGLTAAGAAGVQSVGIEIDVPSPGNTIGGTTPADRNIISGSGTNLQIFSNQNLVSGNFIGTDPTGSLALGGNRGIGLNSASSNTIGGASASSRNVISGNASQAIFIDGGGNGNRILGNFIGPDRAGTTSVQLVGTDGITDAGTATEIGGAASGEGNVISGNFTAVTLFGSDTVVQGNLIGPNAAGTEALPNSVQSRGILLAALQGDPLSGTDILIGGSAPSQRNVISGNNEAAILISAAFDRGALNSRIEGNLIGTDVSGTSALGNQGGIRVDSAIGVTIGGTRAGQGNRIAFNGSSGGIRLQEAPVVSAGSRSWGIRSFRTPAVSGSISVSKASRRTTPPIRIPVRTTSRTSPF